jgi:hypothetical protein
MSVAAPETSLAHKKQARQAAEHTAHHQPAASRTLMRSAVQKPAAKAKKLKAQGHLDHFAGHFLGQVEQHTSVNQLDEQRLQKAKRIKRSQSISRFPQISTVNPPLMQGPDPLKPVLRTAGAPKQNVKPQTTAELLERAIQHAVSHEQPPVKHKRRGKSGRRAGAAGAVALAIILVSVIAGQNSTAAKLQTASATAGFTPILPSYQPAGFKRAELEANKGMVAIGFRSSGNQHSFSLTQKATTGDTTTLLSNYLIDQNLNFQIVKAGDNKVYLYGQKNATWISHGIWFDVRSFGSLDDSQLIRLAASS